MSSLQTARKSSKPHRTAGRTGAAEQPCRAGGSLAASASFPRFVQAKLRIGRPNDQFEHEADRVADAVMRMPDPRAGSAPPIQQSREFPLSASAEAVRCQSESEPPTFPDFPSLASRLEEDVGTNLLNYGHHLYRISTLFPERTDLLEEAFGRYALGANVLETGFGFLGLDQSWAQGLAYGSGILFKGITFATEGELILDFQFDVGHGLKLETSVDLAVNPDDFSDVRKAEVGLGLVGHF